MSLRKSLASFFAHQAAAFGEVSEGISSSLSGLSTRASEYAQSPDELPDPNNPSLKSLVRNALIQKLEKNIAKMKEKNK